MESRLPIILIRNTLIQHIKNAYSLFLFILNYITLLAKYVDNFSEGGGSIVENK